MSSTKTLTSHLLALSTVKPYVAATQHTFLQRAGNGTLSKAELSCYLAQDRLFVAHGGPLFFGHFLSTIPFSSSHSVSSQQEALNKKLVDLASSSLQGIIREAGLFVEISDKFGLGIEKWKERKGTRDYIAEEVKASATGDIGDCLVFLYAMEKIYFDAWTYVKNLRLSTSKDVLNASEISEPLEILVSNWSNHGFAAFVDGIENLVNSMDIQPDSAAWSRAEEIWGRVVELEEGFWPNEEELADLQLEA